MADKDEDLQRQLDNAIRDRDHAISALKRVTNDVISKSASSNEKLQRELQETLKYQREIAEQSKRISNEARVSQEQLDEIVSEVGSAAPQEIKSIIKRLDQYANTVNAILKDDELDLIKKQILETKKFLKKDYAERASMLANTKKMFLDKAIDKADSALSAISMVGAGSITGLIANKIGKGFIDLARESSERKKSLREKSQQDSIVFKEELERIKAEKEAKIKQINYFKETGKHPDSGKKKKGKRAEDPWSDWDSDFFGNEQTIHRKAKTDKGFVKYGFEDSGDMFGMPSFNTDDDNTVHHEKDSDFPLINRVSKSSSGSGDDSETAIQVVELGNKLDTQTDFLKIIIKNQDTQIGHLHSIVQSNEKMSAREELNDFNNLENASESRRVPSASVPTEPHQEKGSSFLKNLFKGGVAGATGGKGSWMPNWLSSMIGAGAGTGIIGAMSKRGIMGMLGRGAGSLLSLPALSALYLGNIGYNAFGSEKSAKQYGTSKSSAMIGNMLNAGSLGLAGGGKGLAKNIDMIKNGFKLDSAMSTRQAGMEQEKSLSDLISKQSKRIDDLKSNGAKESIIMEEERQLNDYEKTLRKLEIENQKLFHTMLVDSGVVNNMKDAQKIQDPVARKKSMWTEMKEAMFGKASDASVLNSSKDMIKSSQNRTTQSIQGKISNVVSQRKLGTVPDEKIDAMITRIAKEVGIDENLVRATISAESAGNPNAKSHKGARGLMQLMPATARGLGVTDINDPEQNLYGGMTYLKQQLDKYGSPEIALAAYNAGPGAVDKYNGNIPPYAETQAYVPKIMSNYRKLQENDRAKALREKARELEDTKMESKKQQLASNIGIKSSSSTNNSYATNVIVASSRNSENTYNQAELESRRFGGY